MSLIPNGARPRGLPCTRPAPTQPLQPLPDLGASQEPPTLRHRRRPKRYLAVLAQSTCTCPCRLQLLHLDHTRRNRGACASALRPDFFGSNLVSVAGREGGGPGKARGAPPPPPSRPGWHCPLLTRVGRQTAGTTKRRLRQGLSCVRATRSPGLGSPPPGTASLSGTARNNGRPPQARGGKD